MRSSCCFGGKGNEEHWVTPDTRASRLAPYLASWKRKVERVGNLNLPPPPCAMPACRAVRWWRSKLPPMAACCEASVRRSSGSGALDEAALTILKLASPFEPFPADLAQGYAQLRFAYQWDFVAGATAFRSCDRIVRYFKGTLRAWALPAYPACMGATEFAG